jgi:hypothetical protein
MPHCVSCEDVADGVFYTQHPTAIIGEKIGTLNKRASASSNLPHKITGAKWS